MGVICGKCGSKRIEEDYVPGIGNAGLICRHCGQTGREGWVTDRTAGSRGRLNVTERIRTDERGADMAKDQLKPGDGAKKLCKKCGERETMSKHSPYCARCLGDMGRVKQQGKQPSGGEVSELTTEASAPKEKAHPGAMTAVTIDFKSYPDLLNSIRQLASEEVRPVDMQIVYLLKSRVSDIKKAAV
jgi:hypothetical protein